MSVRIRADSASKWYGEVAGVQDLTIEITPGITGLVGPNGSGKSTFLRLITGQIRPNQGTIRLGEKDPWSDRSAMRLLGYAPEGEGGPSRATPVAWVGDLALLSGVPAAEIRSRSERALASARLAPEAWNRPLGTLSNGMRQKAKLAQAIVHDPQVLILDEPFSGIDPESRGDLIATVQQLGERGKTVVLSSHNLPDVSRLTDRIALLHRGRLIAAGHVSEIRRLLDRYPFRIRIDASEPRKIAAQLIERPEIEKVSIASERTLIVETLECDAIMNDLVDILSSSSCKVYGFKQEDEDLESVFDYLMRDASRSPIIPSSAP